MKALPWTGVDPITASNQQKVVGLLDDSAAPCCLNSLLQCMFMTPELRHLLHAVEKESKQSTGGDGTPEQQMVPDQDILQCLLGMGFAKNVATRAVHMNAGLEQAMEWALAHSEDEDLDKPLTDYSHGVLDGAVQGNAWDRKRKDSDTGKVVSALQRLFAQLERMDSKAIAAGDLGLSWKEGDSGVKPDARTLHRMLVDAMCTELSKTPLGVLVPTMYKGLMVKTTECQACLRRSSCEEGFADIEVQVRDRKDLLEGLLAYTKPHRLTSNNQLHCERCGGRRDMVRSQQLARLPPVLVFSLDRSKAGTGLVQNEDRFEYPLRLCMQHLMDGAKWDSSPGSEDSSGSAEVEMKLKTLREQLTSQQLGIHDACEEALQSADGDKGRLSNLIIKADLVYDLHGVVIHRARPGAGHHCHAYLRGQGSRFWSASNNNNANSSAKSNNNIVVAMNASVEAASRANEATAARIRADQELVKASAEYEVALKEGANNDGGGRAAAAAGGGGKRKIGGDPAWAGNYVTGLEKMEPVVLAQVCAFIKERGTKKNGKFEIKKQRIADFLEKQYKQKMWYTTHSLVRRNSRYLHNADDKVKDEELEKVILLESYAAPSSAGGIGGGSAGPALEKLQAIMNASKEAAAKAKAAEKAAIKKAKTAEAKVAKLKAEELQADRCSSAMGKGRESESEVIMSQASREAATLVQVATAASERAKQELAVAVEAYTRAAFSFSDDHTVSGDGSEDGMKEGEEEGERRTAGNSCSDTDDDLEGHKKLQETGTAAALTAARIDKEQEWAHAVARYNALSAQGGGSPTTRGRKELGGYPDWAGLETEGLDLMEPIIFSQVCALIKQKGVKNATGQLEIRKKLIMNYLEQTYDQKMRFATHSIVKRNTKYLQVVPGTSEASMDSERVVLLETPTTDANMELVRAAVEAKHDAVTKARAAEKAALERSGAKVNAQVRVGGKADWAGQFSVGLEKEEPAVLEKVCAYILENGKRNSEGKYEIKKMKIAEYLEQTYQQKMLYATHHLVRGNSRYLKNTGPKNEDEKVVLLESYPGPNARSGAGKLRKDVKILHAVSPSSSLLSPPSVWSAHTALGRGHNAAAAAAAGGGGGGSSGRSGGGGGGGGTNRHLDSLHAAVQVKRQALIVAQRHESVVTMKATALREEEVRGRGGEGREGEMEETFAAMPQSEQAEYTMARKLGYWFDFDGETVTPINVRDLQRPFEGEDRASLLIYRGRWLDYKDEGLESFNTTTTCSVPEHSLPLTTKEEQSDVVKNETDLPKLSLRVVLPGQMHRQGVHFVLAEGQQPTLLQVEDNCSIADLKEKLLIAVGGPRMAATRGLPPTFHFAVLGTHGPGYFLNFPVYEPPSTSPQPPYSLGRNAQFSQDTVLLAWNKYVAGEELTGGDAWGRPVTVSLTYLARVDDEKRVRTTLSQRAYFYTYTSVDELRAGVCRYDSRFGSEGCVVVSALTPEENGGPAEVVELVSWDGTNVYMADEDDEQAVALEEGQELLVEWYPSFAERLQPTLAQQEVARRNE